VLLLNTDPVTPCALAAGDRIAQLLLVDVRTPTVVEVDELSPTARDAGGFGSSGS
jgi:dUTP pyrophosphatase